MKNILQFMDGTILSPVMSCEYTEEVNTETDLQYGSAIANCIEVKIWGNISTAPAVDTPIIYFQSSDDGETVKFIDVFYVDTPTRVSDNTYKFTAYCGISKLDTNISDWLRNNQDLFPMTLDALLIQVATLSNVTYTTDSTLAFSSELSIPAFYADDLTARQIFMWAGAINARYAVSSTVLTTEISESTITTTSGDTINQIIIGKECTYITSIKFKEYTTNSTTIGPSPDTHDLFYKSGTLTYSNYTTAIIKRAQIRSSDATDAGVIYPADATGVTYVCPSNMLIQSQTTETLYEIAEFLYNKVSSITYTPCEFTLMRNLDIHAGDIINVTDSSGNTFTTYLMSVVNSASGVKCTCTGNSSRDSASSVAEQSYANTEGKILRISQTVDGLTVTAEQLNEDVSNVKVTVSGITTQVSNTQQLVQSVDSKATTAQETASSASASAESLITRVTNLEQTSQELNVTVSSIISTSCRYDSEGNPVVDKVTTETGFTFNSDGLTITKSGEEMKALIDNTGLYVQRSTGSSNENMLVANNAGVIATDVKVRNFLIVGRYSRFQDFEESGNHRTGCFHVDIGET